MVRANNIFLIGPMGVGKSTIGKQLSDGLKLRFYDSDQEIESSCGASIDWIFDIEGEDGFRQREEKIIHELTEKAGIVLATGGGCVTSQANRNRLSARGMVIYLHATVEQQISRTLYDKKRPLLQVDDRSAQIEKLDQERSVMYEEIADHVIETEGRSVRSVVNDIINFVSSENS